jgi:hypothetical protein
MKNNNFGSFFIVITLVALIGFSGWCVNIYKIIDTGFVMAQWGGLEVARVIGVFVAPLGAVLGFF